MNPRHFLICGGPHMSCAQIIHTKRRGWRFKLTDGKCQFLTHPTEQFRREFSCFRSNELIRTLLWQVECHLTPNRIKRARLSAPGPTLCSLAQSERARPHALQPGACFILKVRPRQSRHLTVFGMRGPLVERPRGARARDQRLCRPAQHDRRRMRGQATVAAEVSSALPARNRVQWACYSRRSRNPARLGCCALHQARRPGKSR